MPITPEYPRLFQKWVMLNLSHLMARIEFIDRQLFAAPGTVFGEHNIVDKNRRDRQVTISGTQKHFKRYQT